MTQPRAIPCGCGGTVQHYHRQGTKFANSTVTWTVVWSVNCISCGMQGPKELSSKEATHAWNRGRGCPTPGDKPTPKYKGTVPFLKGVQQVSIRYGFARDYDEKRENKPFRATLEFIGVVEGACFELQDAAGMKHQMFRRDVLDVLQTQHCRWITGWWAYTKRGKKYGIQYLGESNDA